MDEPILEHHGQNVGDMERKISVVIGGALLAASLFRRTPLSIPLIVGGGYLLFRGLSGNDVFYRALKINRADGESSRPIVVKHTEIIDRPVEEVYRYWRNLENLPLFMRHLDDIRAVDERRSHWVANGPLGTKVEWDAEIVRENSNNYLAWRSLPGSDVQNRGHVEFKPARTGRGTEVKVSMEYRPPGGSAGAEVAKLLGEDPQIQIREDLHRFKRIMEAEHRMD
jgi:uncharacterized membrane protein